MECSDVPYVRQITHVIFYDSKGIGENYRTAMSTWLLFCSSFTCTYLFELLFHSLIFHYYRSLHPLIATRGQYQAEDPVLFAAVICSKIMQACTLHSRAMQLKREKEHNGPLRIGRCSKSAACQDSGGLDGASFGFFYCIAP